MKEKHQTKFKVEMLLGILLSGVLVASTIPSSYAATDCSDIPVKNFRGAVFMDKTLSRNEGSGDAGVLTSYVTESMKYIRLSGFNAVRVPFYWEAYVNDPSSFMAELELIAKKARDNNICVVFDNHHFYTSSHWNLEVKNKSDGRGFPSFVVERFPERNNDYIDTAGPFWNAFLSNSYSIDGTKVWNVQWSFFSKVIKKVDDYGSVAGYEILNEPHLFKKEHYDKLGDYNTFMAKKIRSISDKKIFFDRETTRGFQREPSMELRIFPDGVSGLVYSPHLYSVPTSGSQGMKQINNFEKWADARNTEVLIGEWGADTKSEMVTFLKAFKSNGFGWTAHSWKKSGSSGLGVSLYDSGSTWPTTDLKNLKAAMTTVY